MTVSENNSNTPTSNAQNERQYADINEKLRSLTPEQAKQLSAHLNSVYIRAEETKDER